MWFVKGQVTIFLIVSIILVSGVFVFFEFKDSIFIEDKSVSVGDDVYLFVESCIKEVGIEAVYWIGEGGGYISSPTLSTETGVPYYYYDEKDYMLSKIQMENEISNFINERLFFCTSNFVNFPDLDISQGDIETRVNIEYDRVVLDVNYPIGVSKGNSTDVLEYFNDIEIPIRLGIVYDSIRELIDIQLGDNGLCLSCLLDISLRNNLYVDMMDYDDETIIFIIRDEESIFENKTFEYIFANKYFIK